MSRYSRLTKMLAVLGALMLVLSACADQGADDAQGVNLEDIQQLQSSVDDVNQRITELGEQIGATDVAAQEVVGQQVTVNGAVEEVLDSQTFTITGDDFWQFLEFEPAVLVVMTQGSIPDGLEEGDVVQMTGTPQVFTIVDFESAFGIDLDDTLVIDFEQELAVAAESIEVLGDN